MTESQEPVSPLMRRYSNQTRVQVSQSDIRAVVRAQLRNLKQTISNQSSASKNRITRYHLQDIVDRIDQILDPS